MFVTQQGYLRACPWLCLGFGMMLVSSCEASLARWVHLQCRVDQVASVRETKPGSCCVFVAVLQADGSMSPAVAQFSGASTTTRSPGAPSAPEIRAKSSPGPQSAEQRRPHHPSNCPQAQDQEKVEQKAASLQSEPQRRAAQPDFHWPLNLEPGFKCYLALVNWDLKQN